MRTLVTVQNIQYLNSPYVAVLHQKTTESQPYVHCDSPPSVTVVTNSYAHAQNRLCLPTVPISEAEILNILKLP